ncbi:MAG TPA: DUF1643 domain-containing protein [Pirellulales bacterium]
MLRSATISECGLYRYTLRRCWDEIRGDQAETVVFVGLNPSTADGTLDDPTVRRCVGFAKAWGFGAFVLVNLFAYRATDPTALRGVPDPVGPLNDETLLRETEGRTVVCCWGAGGRLAPPPIRETFEGLRLTVSQLPRDVEVDSILHAAGRELKCLGKTKDGSPRHPLYVPAAQPLVDF